jgi:hypothetical protein
MTWHSKSCPKKIARHHLFLAIRRIIGKIGPWFRKTLPGKGKNEVFLMVVNIRGRIAAGLFAGICLGFVPVASKANVLIGSSVTGALYFGVNPTNYFDPANNYVPAGYLNDMSTTVTISAPAVEFGFADANNTDIVNFSAAQFTVEDVLSSTAGGIDSPFTMTFTDPAFAGLTLNQVSDSFPNGGLSVFLTGTKITATWGGGQVNANDDFTSTSTYQLVPEPSTWALLGLSAGAVALALRLKRRLRA